MGSPTVNLARTEDGLLAPERKQAGGSEDRVAPKPEACCLTQDPVARWLQQKLDQNPALTLPFCWYFHDPSLSPNPL